MRRIIAFDHVSADGYFATEDGRLDWVVPDEELAQFNLRKMAEADTILFGRRTYEMFESFWPNAIKDPRGAEDGVVPVILGKGRKLLDDLEGPYRLALVESRSFPTGTVSLRYSTAKS